MFSSLRAWSGFILFQGSTSIRPRMTVSHYSPTFIPEWFYLLKMWSSRFTNSICLPMIAEKLRSSTAKGPLNVTILLEAQEYSSTWWIQRGMPWMSSSMVMPRDQLSMAAGLEYCRMRSKLALECFSLFWNWKKLRISGAVYSGVVILSMRRLENRQCDPQSITLTVIPSAVPSTRIFSAFMSACTILCSVSSTSTNSSCTNNYFTRPGEFLKYQYRGKQVILRVCSFFFMNTLYSCWLSVRPPSQQASHASCRSILYSISAVRLCTPGCLSNYSFTIPPSKNKLPNHIYLMTTDMSSCLGTCFRAYYRRPLMAFHTRENPPLPISQTFSKPSGQRSPNLLRISSGRSSNRSRGQSDDFLGLIFLSFQEVRLGLMFLWLGV